jgi:ribosomal protein L16 Arg81 hydroxylase
MKHLLMLTITAATLLVLVRLLHPALTSSVIFVASQKKECHPVGMPDLPKFLDRSKWTPAMFRANDARWDGIVAKYRDNFLAQLSQESERRKQIKQQQQLAKIDDCIAIAKDEKTATRLEKTKAALIANHEGRNQYQLFVNGEAVGGTFPNWNLCAKNAITLGHAHRHIQGNIVLHKDKGVEVRRV